MAPVVLTALDNTAMLFISDLSQPAQYLWKTFPNSVFQTLYLLQAIADQSVSETQTSRRWTVLVLAATELIFPHHSW